MPAGLPLCPPGLRPSAAPALSDLVSQDRLRAAGRGSRSESVLRRADKRQKRRQLFEKWSGTLRVCHPALKERGELRQGLKSDIGGKENHQDADQEKPERMPVVLPHDGLLPRGDETDPQRNRKNQAV